MHKLRHVIREEEEGDVHCIWKHNGSKNLGELSSILRQE